LLQKKPYQCERFFFILVGLKLVVAQELFYNFISKKSCASFMPVNFVFIPHANTKKPGYINIYFKVIKEAPKIKQTKFKQALVSGRRVVC